VHPLGSDRSEEGPEMVMSEMEMPEMEMPKMKTPEKVTPEMPEIQETQRQEVVMMETAMQEIHRHHHLIHHPITQDIGLVADNEESITLKTLSQLRLRSLRVLKENQEKISIPGGL